MIRQTIDKPRATEIARNIARHMDAAHGLQIGHAEALSVLAAALGYTNVNTMLAAAKTDESPSTDSSTEPAAGDHDQVFVLRIDDKFGSAIEAFDSSDAAQENLIGMILDNWAEEGLDDEVGDPTQIDDETLIDTYFADHCEKSYSIEAMEIRSKQAQWPGPLHPSNDYRTELAGWIVDRKAGCIRTADTERFATDAEADAFVRRMAARGAFSACGALTLLDQMAHPTTSG